MKIKFTILLLILILLTTTGFGCKGGEKEAKKEILKEVELNMWGVFDSSDDFEEAITAYKLVHPNVKINYKKLRWDEYQDKLLESWAEGTGPDIFALHNTWLGKYENKILPMPTIISLPYVESGGFLNKEQEAVIKQIAGLSPNQIRNIFPEVVYQDVVRNNQVYGLPLSVDTLALFYNRDHLDKAGVVKHPITWEELVGMTDKLVKQDEEGNIVVSAVGLGGADNINRSNDILSLLMMQSGSLMVSDSGKVVFDEELEEDRNVEPGNQALSFYTNFALPSKEVYTWNEDLPEALEMFSAGRLSMMFGYSYQVPIIQAQAPKIDFGIAPMLHINPDGTDALVKDGVVYPVNYADYWVYSVFKQSQYTDEAWDFLNFLATKSYKDENGQTRYYVENYLEETNRPPALRALLNKYRNLNPELKIFVDQILTAQSWYAGKNPDNMNAVFKQMIKNVVLGQTTVDRSVRSAAKAVQETY